MIPTAKKPATKKPATKKPATKKPAGKKPATKKPAAKKPAAKKPAAKKPAAKNHKYSEHDQRVTIRRGGFKDALYSSLGSGLGGAAGWMGGGYLSGKAIQGVEGMFN